jgi:hypothetical protein
MDSKNYSFASVVVGYSVIQSKGKVDFCFQNGQVSYSWRCKRRIGSGCKTYFQSGNNSNQQSPTLQTDVMPLSHAARAK